VLESIVDDLVLSEAEFQQVSDLVYQHCGINLHEGKKELVRARLAKRLRILKIKSFSDYVNYAVNDPTGDEFTMLIDSVSTNLTGFFRENQHFEYLYNVFYPRLIQRKKESGQLRIRAWSAGCSSGEEAYTIAITLLDTLPGQGHWDVKVLATDISTKVLAVAKAGHYDARRVDPLTPQQKQKYLVPVRRNGNKEYEMARSIRDLIVFGHLNLMGEWPIRPPVDFIFCRNVMIYFDKPTQQTLVNRFWHLLDEGGVLFTGHSESLTGIEHKFRYVQPTIYCKA
jgi:chemotaxis protein methyltransferase CheR